MFFMKLETKQKTKHKAHKIFIDKQTFPQTIDVVLGRALPLGIEVIIDDYKNFEPSESYFAAVIQYQMPVAVWKIIKHL